MSGGDPETRHIGDDDPVTIAAARMFYERALAAEAEVERLRTYFDQVPYPSDVEELRHTVEAAARVVEAWDVWIRGGSAAPWSALLTAVEALRARPGVEVSTATGGAETIFGG
jgi:DNA helicase HerA-like ATPase